jgi:hypothetical protein
MKIKIIQSYIFSFLYGCEAWSVTLSVEHRLRVLENRVLRKIFGPKRDKITNRHGGECLMRIFMM